MPNRTFGTHRLDHGRDQPRLHNRRVAEMLGEDEDLLQEICVEMDPEDGCLTVLGPGEETIAAFTRFRVDNLAELINIYKADPSGC